jgi:hypothetical protein
LQRRSPSADALQFSSFEKVFELSGDEGEQLVERAILHLGDLPGIGFEPGEELIAVPEEGEG